MKNHIGLFQKGHKGYWTGKKRPPFTKKHRESMAVSKMEENNPHWKGNKTKYQGIHKWIRSRFGTPKRCEDCGTTKKRMYHWANISKEYRRERDDWKRLCVSCHMKYDKINVKV